MTVNSPPVNVILMEYRADYLINPPSVFTFNMNIDHEPQINSSLTPVSGVFIAQQFSSFEISNNLFYDEDSDLTYQLCKLCKNHSTKCGV